MGELTPAQYKRMVEDGKLKKWLDAGTIDQAKYDSVIQKVQAYNTGVPNPADQPPDMAAQPTAGQQAAAYKTPVEYVRPSAHVPGLGDAPVKDGSWWDDAKKVMPQAVRDTILGIGKTIAPYGADDLMRSAEGTFTLPSRGPVWLEPSDAEAEQAVYREQEMDGLEPQSSHEVLQRWKDKKWAEAFDRAKKRGEALYRGRDIDDESPHFMKVAKRAAENVGVVEAAARKFDESYTFGKLGAVLDTDPWGTEQHAQSREMQEELGLPPPTGYFRTPTAEEDQETARFNIERGRRTVEASPIGAAGGGLVGALAPGSAPNRLAAGVGKVIKPLIAGKGLVSGAVKTALEAGVAGGAERLSVNATNRMANEAAGLPQGDIMEGVGTSAGLGAVVGTALGIPGGVSRGMRGVDDEIAASHKVIEQDGRKSTKFLDQEGLNPPAGHDEMLEKYGTQGVYAGARSEAVNAAADVLERRAERANWSTYVVADDITDELDYAGTAIGSETSEMADELVMRGEKSDQFMEVRSRRFTKNLMDRVEAELTTGKKRMQEETEAAIKMEGAPDYPAIPGPDMHFSDIKEAAETANDNDLGLDTDYPSISVDRIIDKQHEIMQKLAYKDQVPMSSTTHAKMKEAADMMYIKKVVSEEEAQVYKDVAHNMKELGNGDVEILLPRLVSARELNDMIGHFDEMAKYASNSADPRAADYKELGAIARELREESFQVLAGTKLQHHQQIRENEEMLRAIGLPKNITEIDPTSVDQVALVMDRIKTMAKSREYKTPEGLGVPRVAFENWLAKYDVDLLDDYMKVKSLARQKENVGGFNIMIENTPAQRAASFKKVEEAILGNRRDADAIMATFDSVSDRVRSLRARKAEVDDIYSMFGVSNTMRGMSMADRGKMRVKFNQICAEGGDEFKAIRAKMKPEHQQMMDVARQAAGDTDDMFRTLGFGPNHNRPGFQSAERADIVDGLHSMFDNYKRYGKSIDFDRSVDKLFKEHPNVKTALSRMSKMRAFQILRGEAEGAAMPVLGMAKPRTFLIAAKDFFRNHIDAMVTRKKGSKAVFDVPAPWAVGLTQESGQPQREDEDEEGLSSISSVAALQAMIRAVSKIESEESDK